MAITVFSDGDTVTGDNISNLPADALGWEVKTTTYTAVKRDNILADTSGGAWTLTLPSSPSNNDTVGIADAADSFETNNLTINGNGTNIHGDSTLTVNIKNATFFLRYNSTQGEWRLTGI